MTNKEIHDALFDDEAYVFSVDNQNVINMQMVLRAYGYQHGIFFAHNQIDYARNDMGVS